jgi:hypothetical protein
MSFLARPLNSLVLVMRWSYLADIDLLDNDEDKLSRIAMYRKIPIAVSYT